jgi:hypothetical protein
VVRIAHSCKSAAESPITWNQRGPTGPRGGRGPAGQDGAAGATGAAGAQGIPGPSHAWTGQASPGTNLTGSFVSQMSTGTSLNSGQNYLAFAGVVLAETGHTNPVTADCQLLSGSTVIDSVATLLGASEEDSVYLSAAAAPITAGTFSVQCKQSGTGQATVEDGHLTVVQVGALN